MDFTRSRNGTDGNDVFDNRVDPVFNTFGGRGDDTFVTDEFSNFSGGPGNDTVNGGTAGATAIYWDSPKGIYVDLAAGYADDGWGTRDTLHQVNTIQATGGDDTLLGDVANNEFWPGNGKDIIDGRGGVDTITLSARPQDVIWSRTEESWQYAYKTSNGALLGTGTVKDVELVRYYSDSKFSGYLRLRSSDSTPSALRFDPVSPKLDMELMNSSPWKIGDLGIAVRIVNESYPPYYYPTFTDYHGGGIFGPNAHNAVVGDFNGDGKEDIWLSWVAFPHTLVRQTALPPTILFSTNEGLKALDAGFIPSSLNRHMAYRTMVADFNGDGVDDVAFGGMGIITRLPDGTYSNTWERNGIALFTGGSVVDATSHLEGQGTQADLTNWGFAHDGSAGDVNGDALGDLYAGGRLWVSGKDANWSLATDLLPSEVPRSPPMSSAMGDLDGDGRDDLAIFWQSFQNAAYAILSNRKAFPSFTAIALPPLLFGANSKANNCAITDLNADGLGDIVVATTRSVPYYQGAALQILIQVSPGKFEDQTSSRIDNSASDQAQGEGQLRVFDANGDGLVDIVHSLDSRGANVFLNDGFGHFRLFDLSGVPYVQQGDIEGLQGVNARAAPQISKLFPIDVNSDGLADFVSSVGIGDYATSSGNMVALYTLTSNENIWGRERSETLQGTQLAELIKGYSGDDVISGLGGNDFIDGGAGADTCVYITRMAAYTLSPTAISGPDGSDTLTSIERLQFTDAFLAFDLDGNAGQTYRLYQAAFNRTPDLGGLGGWIGGRDGGLTPTQVATSFMGSAEFQALYGSNPTNEQFVSLLYTNALHRNADSGGLAYWVNQLASGLQTRAQALVNLSESAENKASVLPAITKGIVYANAAQAAGPAKGQSFSGTSGADSLIGTVGNDTLTGGAGNDAINGGGGLDMAIYSGTRASHTAANASGVLTVSGSANGVDTLNNVERLKFDDAILAMDTAGNAGQTYRLYQAAFNRTPDKAGLSDWVKGMDTGLTLTQMATAFIGSGEFKSKYGENPTNAQFVDLLYTNALHRARAVGDDYWTNQLDSGVTREQALIGFSESAENQASLIGVIQNGIELNI